MNRLSIPEFLKQIEIELDKRCKVMPNLTPEIATNVLNVIKQMTTEEMLNHIRECSQHESSDVKRYKLAKKFVERLMDRLGTFGNPSSNSDIDSTAKKQPKPQLPKPVISNSSRQTDSNEPVHSTDKKDTNTFKKDVFSSQDEVDYCFLNSLSMGTETKSGLIVAMENLVINAANLVFQEHFNRKGFMSYRETLGDQVESFLKSQFEKEAEKLGDTKELAEGIHLLHPDGFFCIEGYDKPIMICNYKAPDELTEEDSKWLNNYGQACKDANIPATEMFYPNSKLPEYENDPNIIKFKDIFQDVHTNSTKYGTGCACVSSGRCWIFLFTPQDKLGSVGYYSVFAHDYESFKKAFDYLLALLLDSSTKILEKKKSGEFDKFDERYQLFKESSVGH